MKYVATLALLATLVLAAAVPAGAVSITQIESFSGQFAFIGVTPFDPTLGTLDSVRVDISGVLTLQGTTGLNLLPLGPFGELLAQPYDFLVDVNQQFFGLGGRYFEFNGPGTVRFTEHATGNGEPLVGTSPFSYDFTFNTFTDLAGFTLPTTSGVIPPLGGIIGTRARFTDNGIPINEVDLVQSFTLSGQAPVTTPTIVSSVSSGGLLQITYDYTPPVTAVAEPSSLLLLALGLAAVVTRRRAG